MERMGVHMYTRISVGYLLYQCVVYLINNVMTYEKVTLKNKTIIVFEKLLIQSDVHFVSFFTRFVFIARRSKRTIKEKPPKKRTEARVKVRNVG